jgi:hypothetical protein
LNHILLMSYETELKTLLPPCQIMDSWTLPRVEICPTFLYNEIRVVAFKRRTDLSDPMPLGMEHWLWQWVCRVIRTCLKCLMMCFTILACSDEKYVKQIWAFSKIFEYDQQTMTCQSPESKKYLQNDRYTNNWLLNKSSFWDFCMFVTFLKIKILVVLVVF